MLTNCGLRSHSIGLSLLGKKFIKKLDGMFAISIYDKKDNRFYYLEMIGYKTSILLL